MRGRCLKRTHYSKKENNYGNLHFSEEIRKTRIPIVDTKHYHFALFGNSTNTKSIQGKKGNVQTMVVFASILRHPYAFLF